jgi:hypothetical protein
VEKGDKEEAQVLLGWVYSFIEETAKLFQARKQRFKKLIPQLHPVHVGVRLAIQSE